MRAWSLLVAWGLIATQHLGGQAYGTGDTNVSSQAKEQLISILSNRSTIYLPSDPEWADETERYNDLARPNIQLVIQVGEESDISKIVSPPSLCHCLPPARLTYIQKLKGAIRQSERH